MAHCTSIQIKTIVSLLLSFKILALSKQAVLAYDSDFPCRCAILYTQFFPKKKAPFAELANIECSDQVCLKISMYAALGEGVFVTVRIFHVDCLVWGDLAIEKGQRDTGVTGSVFLLPWRSLLKVHVAGFNFDTAGLNGELN